MLNRFAIAGTVAFSLSVAVAANAQRSVASAPQPSTSPQTSDAERKVHLEGCVFPKRALQTTAPIIVPQGSNEDYILSDPKVISASPGVTVPDGKIFKLDRVASETLRALIGQRVGVTARVDEKPGLSELQVIGIREISGGCPVAPRALPAISDRAQHEAP